jgi:hypothetical protein
MPDRMYQNLLRFAIICHKNMRKRKEEKISGHSSITGSLEYSQDSFRKTDTSKISETYRMWALIFVLFT